MSIGQMHRLTAVLILDMIVTMRDERCLTLTEAAKALGITTSALSHARRRGKITGHAYNDRDYEYAPEEIERYRREVQSAPRGVASPDHPYHGKRGGGGRRKREPVAQPVEHP